VFAGLLLVSQGAFELSRGHPFYPNYWRGPVFAWFAIIVGAVISALALFVPDKLRNARVGKGAVVPPGQGSRH
jgi:hypothetical protein